MAQKIEFVLLEVRCSFCNNVLSDKEKFDCEKQKTIPVCSDDSDALQIKLRELQPLWESMSF
jgi:NAD-dependent SIR2 family protein deacetylase